jgi:hypothetical protein
MPAPLALPRRPRSQRIAHRVAAALLALPLLATVATAAPAAAHTASDTLEVGDLTYSSGAGTETWGLRTHAAWSARVVKRRHTVGTVYGYRQSSTSDHGKGLAADFMVYSNAHKGRHIARFAKRHHRQLNVTYVIWNQRVWSVARAGEGWRPMADAGSATANHKDHVHVSFRETPHDDTYRG